MLGVSHSFTTPRCSNKRSLTIGIRILLETNDLQNHFGALARKKNLPSLQTLLSHVVVLNQRYSSTAAYERALSGQTTPHDDRRAPTEASLAADIDSSHDEGSEGDWALANTILLMRDGSWSLEVCQAVASGDIRRVWEVLKVSDSQTLPHAAKYSPGVRSGSLRLQVLATRTTHSIFSRYTAT